MSEKCSFCSFNLQTNKEIFKCPNCNQIIICPSSTPKMPHNTLKEIVDVFGVNIFSKKIRLKGILSDLIRNKLIRKIILLASKDNVHQKLLNTTRSNNSIKIETLKYFFATQNFLYKEVADYIIDSFAYSLGLIKTIDYINLNKINDWFTDSSVQNNFSVYEKIKPAKILDFSLKEPYVLENEPFLIHWNAINITRAYIENEEIPIHNTKYKTKISGYKKFLLTVENEHFKDSMSLEIQPIKKPRILDFNVSKTHLKAGEEVRLSWKFKDSNRTSLIINNKEIDATHLNEYKLTTNSNLKCKLTAYALNDLHPVSNTKHITIVKPVEINVFKVNKERIIESDKIILSWEVVNANKILLLPLQKNVSNLNQIELLPTKTTTYTLEVSNEIFKKQKNVSVILHKMPTLNKISFPEIPSLKIPLPNLKLNTSFKEPITNQMKNATWYNKLFSFDLVSFNSLVLSKMGSINKKVIKILNQLKG